MTSTTQTPRSFRRPLLTTGALVAGVALAIGAPLAASAHVSVIGTSTAAGSSSQLTFAVPHGCDGAATTAIAITIPEGINAVTPTVNPNWTASKTMADLPDPVKDSSGKSIAERVSTVTYTAKVPLEEGFRDTFTLGVTLPDTEGATLVFPVSQTCETGSTNWDQVAAEGQNEHDLDAPAPTLAITAAAPEAGEHGDHAAAASDTAAATESGDDTVARTLGIAGLVVGALGLIAGALAITRRPKAAK